MIEDILFEVRVLLDLTENQLAYKLKINYRTYDNYKKGKYISNKLNKRFRSFLDKNMTDNNIINNKLIKLKNQIY